MIASENIRKNFCINNLRFQFLAHKYIVNTPADVALACFGEMAPPGVVTVALGEHTKRINESSRNYIVDTLTFFIRESFVADVFFGPC